MKLFKMTSYMTRQREKIFQDRTPKQEFKTFSDKHMCSRMKVTDMDDLIKADQMLFVHAVQL